VSRRYHLLLLKNIYLDDNSRIKSLASNFGCDDAVVMKVSVPIVNAVTVNGIEWDEGDRT
jgi:hypothetical protein